jgi:hypothetical protein
MQKQNILVAEGESRSIILYRDGSNSPRVEVLFRAEMLWMTQKQIALLFDVQKAAVSKHLKNIYETGELIELATVSVMETVQTEGSRSVKRSVSHYSLDAIIAVGYRVNSERAIIFRNWATSVLREYIQKGSVLDVERLKQPEYIYGQDYFDETLERIRDIRASERRFYQKITDIYAQCSADYDRDNEITCQFYATVQNKLHWAIVGETAAEIVYHRADAEKSHMGLTTWKNAPEGEIRRPDVSIAKNYLSEIELASLNRIVSMYLDYAELQAENRQVMYMKDWAEKLNAFLAFNEKEVLNDNGEVTHELAKAFAEAQFEKYRAVRDRTLESDFDRFLMLENSLFEVRER